jgi:peptide chain release factor subunit 1
VHAERFRQVVAAEGPFASVYFEDSHDTEDAAKQRELTWRSLRQILAESGAPETVLAALEKAVLDSPPAVARSGRGLVAVAHHVVLDEHLLRPPARTEARYSPLPYLVPVIEHAASASPYLLVAVDHEGADISVHDTEGHLVRSETIERGEYPVHKAAGAETAGYGDPQPAAEEAARRNIAAVADRVTALIDEHVTEPVFVIGEVRSRADLLGALSERARAVTVALEGGARAAGAGADGVEDAIDTELARRRLAVIDDAAERFRAETGRGSGLAVDGLGAVCAALRAGSVDTLIIGDLEDRTVLVGDGPTSIAVDADQLSELGSTQAAPRRADEALPIAAIANGSVLIRTDERIDPVDGCAALLRYAS